MSIVAALVARMALKETHHEAFHEYGEHLTDKEEGI